MPEITRFTQQVRATGLQRTGDTRGAFGGQMGEDLQKAGQQLEQYATKVATADYIAKKSQFEIDLMSMEQELSTADVEDASAAYQEAYQQKSAEFEQSLSPLVSERWGQDNAAYSVSFARAGLANKVERDATKRSLDWGNAYDNYTQIVSQNPNRKDEAVSELSGLLDTFRLSPEEKALQLDAASDKLTAIQQSTYRKNFVSSIENDPFSFIEKYNQNPDGYKKSDYDFARKQLADTVDQAEKVKETDEIVKSYGFAVKLGRGELTLAEVEAEASLNGETSLVKSARKAFIAKTPQRTDVERAQVENELETRRLIITKRLESEGVTTQNLKSFKELQQDVLEASGEGYLTGAQTSRLSGHSEELLKAVNENVTAKVSGQFKFGIQSPYDYAFEKMDSFIEDEGLVSNQDIPSEFPLLFKRDVLNNFESYLGDYESSGSHKKDRDTINEALRNAKGDYFVNALPNYTDKEDLPAVINFNGVDINTGFSGKGKKDVVPKRFTAEMEDGDGNRALVEVDASGNYISTIREIN